jgi:hypothetical protein
MVRRRCLFLIYFPVQMSFLFSEFFGPFSPVSKLDLSSSYVLF